MGKSIIWEMPSMEMKGNMWNKKKRLANQAGHFPFWQRMLPSIVRQFSAAHEGGKTKRIPPLKEHLGRIRRAFPSETV